MEGLGFDRTYEGLKPNSFAIAHLLKTGFDRTYEGLKRRPLQALCEAYSLVLTVPMRV